MMNRRDLFKLAGAAGLTLSGPLSWLSGSNAIAQEDTSEPYSGPLFLFVNAAGGWDPTSLCDPKGRVNEDEEKPVNKFFKDEIDTAGNITYAPVEGHKEFFDRHYQKMTVINGIDTATNGHDSGSRHIWSGNLAEGHPSLGALIAAVHAPGKAMAYITNGGYDLTQGIVSRTRVGNIGAIQRIAFVNDIDPNNNDQNDLFHTTNTMSRIQAAQKARMESKISNSHLPHEHAALNTLHLARGSDNELQRLTEYLPEISGSNLKKQAQVAIAAYRAGLSVAANLGVGGFDTHGNHDQNQFAALQRLLSGINEIWDEADRAGVADKIVVVVGSDFGRTPYYNNNDGKDHWSVTSMMIMGAGIPGNKVIGASNDRFSLKTIDPGSLNVLDNPEEGIRITPAHIHAQLRKLAGVHDIETAQRFPLKVDDIPLLGL